MTTSINKSSEVVRAELILTPSLHVFLDVSPRAEEEVPLPLVYTLQPFFEKSSLHGLLHLGLRQWAETLPPSFFFWHNFSQKCVAEFCKKTQSTDEPDTKFSIDEKILEKMIDSAPFMKGAEHLFIDGLKHVWISLEALLLSELQTYSGTATQYFASFNPHWNLVGKICFHLAENKQDNKRPFAFLATFTNRLHKKGEAQHIPLKQALQMYAGENNKTSLLSILLPIQKVSQKSSFINDLFSSGQLFSPLLWTPQEAYRFLKEIPVFESFGIIVRMPNWQKTNKPQRPTVKVTVGGNSAPAIGLSTLLDFNIQLALDDGTHLSQEEWDEILNSNDPLVKIKGQWIEVNQEKLQTVLKQWNTFKKHFSSGMPLAEALRLLSGGKLSLTKDTDATEIKTQDWSCVVAGPWLKEALEQLKNPEHTPEAFIDTHLANSLHATLRPYQHVGVRWLWLLYQLRLGGCLADDMGLGKTLQVIALIMLIRKSKECHQEKTPHLLIVPASLLGNWKKELTKFAPSLPFTIAHNSETFSTTPCTKDSLVITTYSSLSKFAWISDTDWDLVVIDEAQNIKNHQTKQTKAIKKLKSQVRLALTGTPVENRLSDLWSLFDFTSPGLLGSASTFSSYIKKGKQTSENDFANFMSSLRSLTRPYILRRLKTDKRIIDDLPEKTEIQLACSLTKGQIKLYQQTLQELQKALSHKEGIERKGLILSSLMRLKQICNHPAQWLGYGEFIKEESGKFLALQALSEKIAEKNERMLVFTQFRELIPALARLLHNVFGKEGLELHGKTDIKKRPLIVEQFQKENGPPFMVLSLKAGGTGLTLTQASHVVHFDRWWNPAVENQATDRAYRIGQKQAVLVHKLICQGTIEEKIDELISSKKKLSSELLDQDEGKLITDLTDTELMQMVSLDIQKAMGE